MCSTAVQYLNGPFEFDCLHVIMRGKATCIDITWQHQPNNNKNKKRPGAGRARAAGQGTLVGLLAFFYEAGRRHLGDRGVQARGPMRGVLNKQHYFNSPRSPIAN